MERPFSLQMDFFYEKRKGILMQRQSVPTGAGFLAASVLWGNLGKAGKIKALMHCWNLKIVLLPDCSIHYAGM